MDRADAGNVVTVTPSTVPSNAYSMNRCGTPKCVIAVRLRSESASIAGVIHSDHFSPSADTRILTAADADHDTAADSNGCDTTTFRATAPQWASQAMAAAKKSVSTVKSYVIPSVSEGPVWAGGAPHTRPGPSLLSG